MILQPTQKDCVKHAGKINAENRAQLDQTMRKLPENQSGKGRHKCAYCAYEAGFNHGFRKALAKVSKFTSETAKLRQSGSCGNA